MAPRKQYIPIQPSHLEYENTGVFVSGGRQFKVIGFDLDTNRAEVKNDRGEYRLMTNRQIEEMIAVPTQVAAPAPIGADHPTPPTQ